MKLSNVKFEDVGDDTILTLEDIDGVETAMHLFLIIRKLIKACKEDEVSGGDIVFELDGAKVSIRVAINE